MHHDDSILIVGAGAFGTSTARHLEQRGYTNITVLDKYPVPSCEAASTDISKIVRTDYNEPLYARLATEAMALWKSDLLKDLFHVTGWYLSAMDLSVPFVKGSFEVNKKLGIEGLEAVTVDEIRKRHPVVKGKLDGWNVNVWNPHAAWVEADVALQRVAEEAQKKGVRFVSGAEGEAVDVLVDGASGKCTGVRTRGGKVWTADVVLLSSGAWTQQLVDLSSQLVAKGHGVAHIQLTEEEAAEHAKLPVMDNLELGYYFPPARDRIFKLAHSRFVVNHKESSKGKGLASVPHTLHENPDDDLPLEIEATMRRNLRRVFPQLADRPFCYTRLCWDADTADRHLLVTPYPKTTNLYLACGGSAHSYKFMPVIGKYIADMLEGKLEEGIAEKWRWRAGEKLNGSNLAHLDPELELSDLTGWKGRKAREVARARL